MRCLLLRWLRFSFLIFLSRFYWILFFDLMRFTEFLIMIMVLIMIMDYGYDVLVFERCIYLIFVYGIAAV